MEKVIHAFMLKSFVVVFWLIFKLTVRQFYKLKSEEYECIYYFLVPSYLWFHAIFKCRLCGGGQFSAVITATIVPRRTHLGRIKVKFSINRATLSLCLSSLIKCIKILSIFGMYSFHFSSIKWPQKAVCFIYLHSTNANRLRG